ncbi:DUF2630 family protein [Nocardioides sp. KR10-350]|uniref:DUF2630 family protein n=1 Tax=Nocardioides cheoyonin TaxID=3156615 RepID=UPI0032B43BCF
MTEDLDIRHRISALVSEERELRDQLSEGEISVSDEHERLKAVETELDQCWDLLRQRDALRNAGEDPSSASVRPEGVVENYLE